MVSLHRKCLQVGLIVGFGAFLIAHAKPLPLPEIEPSLRAGASNLPVVKWQETEITKAEPETFTVAEVVPDIVSEPSEETVDELPEGEATTEDFWEVQPDYEELDLLYRTVQAEGYTMGYEGMRLITDAILNLAEHQGVSVTDCILSPGQFTVISTGAIWREPIYQDTIDAVLTEVKGPRIDYEIKYFRTDHFHGFGHPCFRFGNVYFSS